MHRFFPILTTFLTFCFIAILAMPVHASSHENAPVMETIVVSTPPTGWPPFIIPPKNKENDTGIMMEIMDTITNRIGYHMNTVHFPEKRSQMLLAEGRVDAYAKAKEWVKNPSLYSWTDPIVTTTDVLVFLKKSPIQFQTPKDLSGLNIGIVYGFSYPTLDPLFDKAIIKCHTSKCTKNLLLMVQRGHIHAAATNRHVAEWIIKNNSELSTADFAYSTTPIGSAPYRFAFSKNRNWTPFIKSFNRELASMKRNGEFEKIMSRYR